MSKPSAPPFSEPPPYAPPSYSQAVGGVPPQAPFTPMQVAAPTAIVTTVVPLGSQSTHMICPHCHSEIDTATKTSPSVVAWLSGFIICILGCWLGCCLIPCCINECMNVEHNCPNCQAFLGKYKRG
ncbi:LITAF domain-containing protein-like isoform X1 [Penaeus indicus]|uniref:LITAF domain-containing protein-like isoform X1 n=1 Tax=Penaeus chinensis TaxID=139456 RepID=UPI001FB6737F|nr:LITAF domain-containing protein-like isoform X1 [Penaeus chinensis]XP_047478159.1 LITAF domain-containing protein-like isoform X1 [Penaeus chinensis]